MLSSILIISLFFVVYAFFHSFTAGLAFKRWMRRLFGPEVKRWYRLVYNILAVVTFLPLFPLVAFLPDRLLYVVPVPWRWLMLAGQAVAGLGVVVVLWQTGLWHFLGLSQAVADEPEQSGSLEVSGFYAWVRHPLYFLSLVFLWLTPVMSANLLAAYILFTIYFYVGAMHEERRLVAEFGPAYRRYQRQVPRLIPRPWRRYTPPSEDSAPGG